MIEVIGVLLAILIPLIGFLYNRYRKAKKYFEIMWKESSSLKPEEVLGLRGESKYGFHRYYYPRKEDELIREKIENGKNVLIIGNPLAGKSRAIYQALINLKNSYDVIIPRLVDIDLTDFRIPTHFSSGKKGILVLNDLDKFVELQNFMHLLQEFLKRDTIIIGSCRSGPEYEILCNRMEKELSSIFGNPIEIPEISDEEGEGVAKRTGRELPYTFDGNIGSIF